jgi:hypothetical protein
MRCKADPFRGLADRSREVCGSRVEMAAMLRAPDGEIVWGVRDSVDWSVAALVLLEYHKSQIQDACLQLQDRTQNVCICPRASASNGKGGRCKLYASCCELDQEIHAQFSECLSRGPLQVR